MDVHKLKDRIASAVTALGANPPNLSSLDGRASSTIAKGEFDKSGRCPHDAPWRTSADIGETKSRPIGRPLALTFRLTIAGILNETEKSECGVRRGNIRLIHIFALSGLLGWASGFSGLAEPVKFVLAADDGYGVEDCLVGGNECGQTVADAWCEAHGQGTAIAFGAQAMSLADGGKLHGTLSGVQITCGN